MTRTLRPRRLASTSVALAGLFAAACIGADAPTDDAAVTITDSAGVTLVRFADPASLPVPERALTLSAEVVRVLSIG